MIAGITENLPFRTIPNPLYLKECGCTPEVIMNSIDIGIEIIANLVILSSTS